MKKSTKIKVGVGMLVLISLATAVSVVGYKHYNKFIAPNKTPGDLENNQKEKEKKLIEDLIPKEDSDKAKKELEDFENKQENSKDIIVPDDATEEEKEQLQSKKTYLQIHENVAKLLSEACKDCDSSKLIDIEQIYQTPDGYVFYVSSINQIGAKFFNSSTLLQIKTQEANNFEDLNNSFSNVKTAEILQSFHSYARCEELNKEVFRLSVENNLFEGETGHIVDMSTNLILGSERAPTHSIIFYKLSHETASGIVRNSYILTDVDYNAYALGATYNDLVGTMKSLENESFFTTNLALLNDSNLDWIEYKNKNKNVNVTDLLIESLSVKNNDGKCVSMDWNAYKDLMKQKEAEKEAKELEQNMTQETKVIYSEQELGF